eukprot:7956826-Alexandrium_andersonii.AAC.1
MCIRDRPCQCVSSLQKSGAGARRGTCGDSRAPPCDQHTPQLGFGMVDSSQFATVAEIAGVQRGRVQPGSTVAG